MIRENGSLRSCETESADISERRRNDDPFGVGGTILTL